jgi:hypothetical protein
LALDREVTDALAGSGKHRPRTIVLDASTLKFACKINQACC